MSDEEQFARFCRGAVTECQSLGYYPTAWEAMIERWGAVEASKQLIQNGDIQSGLLRLLRLGREDLTIEATVLQPRWAKLFNDTDRELARWRLAEAHRMR